MTIEPGMMLKHYRLIEKIGEGGMGIVWKAADLSLSREIAIKILPDAFVNDPERLARFEREAKAVAALNHPNIVTVHSVEQVEDLHFITMELVRGKTLGELIRRTGLPLGKFFELAVPLADALTAAHDRGIVHRDLKPDNVLVGADGRLRVLDFGLAKLQQDTSSQQETQLPTASVTQEGRILGTVAYMSPEQAEGKPVDPRSDIFSLGVILYQMATGRRPFTGDTGVSVLSSILKDRPPSITELDPSLPRHLGRIVKRCLSKDPLRRYQSALDLRNDLDELKTEIDSGQIEAVGSRTGKGSRGLRWALAGVAAVVVLLLFYLTVVQRRDSTQAGSALQASFTRITSGVGRETAPSLSPDGKTVVYSAADEEGDRDIYTQRVGGTRAINLTADSADDDSSPKFSPDAQSIVFRSERQGGGVFVMGATGEAVRRLTDFGYDPAWSADGSAVVFTTERFLHVGTATTVSELWRVELADGETRRLRDADTRQPRPSPHGQRVAYYAQVDGQRDVWTVPATGGEPVAVTTDAKSDWSPAWSPDGRYLYFSSDRGGSANIWRVPIDEESGLVRGNPEPITSGASASSREGTSIAGDGRHLVYEERFVDDDVVRVEFDPETETLTGVPVTIVGGSDAVVSPAASPDGEWIAFVDSGPPKDLVIARSDGTGRRRLTDDAHKDWVPRWSPDGERILFYSNRSGSYELWTIRPDGADLRQLTNAPDKTLLLGVWSPDGSRIAFCDLGGGKTTYLMDADVSWTEQTVRKLPPGGDDFFAPTSWSPDGRWLAGIRFAHKEIVIYSLETEEYRKVLNTEDTSYAVWLGDSRRLLFADGGTLFVADAQSGERREIVSPPGTFISNPTTSADGRTLYFTSSTEDGDIWLLELN